MLHTANLPPAIIVSGGIAHDFSRSSAELAVILEELGFVSTITEDVNAVFAGLSGEARPPLVILNLLRFTMDLGRYSHLKERWGLWLSRRAKGGLTQHVAGGGGLLAMHGASICFDDWAEWPEILGGQWRWGVSSHPPLSTAHVTVQNTLHPIVHGIDDFTIEDEVYGFLDVKPNVTALMTSPHGGVEHPLLWAREVGHGRVVYDALGHHVASLRNPAHRAIVGRSALWAAGQN